MINLQTWILNSIFYYYNNTNKIIIPSILGIVVLVAGIFSFLPVQQTSTVHDSETMTFGKNSITNEKIANNSINVEELADAVEPLNNVLSVSTGDLSTPLDADCGNNSDPFLIHFIITGVATDTVEIDLTDNNSAEITHTFPTNPTTFTGTVAGAKNKTVEFTGSANVAAIITVVCTGNGTPAIT